MADYLEGELSLSKRALFDAHLDACDDCTRELAAMRDTISLLRRLVSPEPPVDLTENVMQRIAQGEGQPGWGDRVAGWFGDFSALMAGPRFVVPATAFAACLAVFVATGEQGSFTLPGTEDEAAVTQVAQAKRPRAQSPAPERPQALARQSSEAARPRLGMRGTALTNESMQAPVGFRRSAADRSLEMASAQAGGAVEVQSIRSRDEWLEVLIQQPLVFAREHVELSSVEQELWITHLARRAAELRRLEEVVAALRGTPDPIAAALADSFADELPRQEFAGQRLRGSGKARDGRNTRNK